MLRYRAEMRRCREEAGARLADFALGHVADRPAHALAYGEQRLLEIAIALALKPRVLLLDEPAAGVPKAEAGVIHDMLDRLPAEVAVLIIEHDMDLVFRFAREIAVLVQGALLRRGTPDEIVADPEVRAVYLGRSAA
jgi:branched-chain amino acid transport system ATP-binding protein